MSEENGPTEEELADNHNKMLSLMRDVSIQQASVTFMAGMRLTALARLVMERTFDEEEAEESVRACLIEALRDKAKSELDLLSLRTAVVDALPVFLDEEISRLKSEKNTKELMRSAGNQGFSVQLNDKMKIALPRGHLLLLIGSHATVSYTISSLCNEDRLMYEDGQSVEPEMTLLLSTQMGHGDSSRGALPLFEWQGRATSPRNWAALENIIENRFQKKFPLWLVTNGNMLGNFPPRTDKTQSYETRTALSLVRRILANNRQSAIVGIYETDQEPELAAEIENGFRRHANVTVMQLSEKGKK